MTVDKQLTIEDFNVEEFHYDFIVQETHLDTFGHINNATYLTIFEQARWDLITNNGWGLDRIMRDKKGPVITEINIKYKAELRLRQNVQIRTKVSEFKNNKVLTIKQEMIDEKGRVCCEFTMDAGLFDLKQRKLIAGEADWLKAIGLTPKN